MKGNNLIKPRNSLNGSGVDLERIFLEDMKKENYYVCQQENISKKKEASHMSDGPIFQCHQ